jgi:hypothetical protein
VSSAAQARVLCGLYIGKDSCVMRAASGNLADSFHLSPLINLFTISSAETI